MIKQYLTFTLDKTIYAAEVSQVQEVLEYEPPQPLPCPDPVIAGLIRSRGRSISVINLRRKFGIEDAEPGAETRIVVFEIPDAESGVTNYLGAVTDSVLEVLEIENTDLEPPPETGKSPAAKFICGIGRKDDKFIIILDFTKVFSFEELSGMSALACSTSEGQKS